MRKIFRNLLHGVVLLEAYFLTILLPKAQRQTGRRVAVLEPCPTSFGSAGDEALISGVSRFAQERSSTGQVFVVSFHSPYRGILPEGTSHGGCLHSSGNPLRRLLAYLAWPFLLRRFDSFYIIGADLIDGYYSAQVSCFLFFLARLASLLGLDTHIISASFNENPPDDVKQCISKLPSSVRLHLRDKFSAQRVEAILKRPVSHSADVAFGLVPTETTSSREITGWMMKHKVEGRPVLVLNINLLPVNKQFAGRENEYLSQWRFWVEAMTRAGCAIVLIAHDYRGEWGDQIAAEKVYSELSPGNRSFCLLPSVSLHAAEIKAIARQTNLVVTGRMHLAIGALGSGIPVVGYAYQSKFEGIFNLFGQKGMVRSMDGVFSDIGVEVKFCLQALDSTDATRTVINRHLCEVMNLASINVTR